MSTAEIINLILKIVSLLGKETINLAMLLPENRKRHYVDRDLTTECLTCAQPTNTKPWLPRVLRESLTPEQYNKVAQALDQGSHYAFSGGSGCFTLKKLAEVLMSLE